MSTTIKTPGSVVGTLAVSIRHGAPPERIDELRRDLTEAKLAKAIRAALDETPAMTAEQRVRLGRMITSGASS